MAFFAFSARFLVVSPLATPTAQPTLSPTAFHVMFLFLLYEFERRDREQISALAWRARCRLRLVRSLQVPIFGGVYDSACRIEATT